MLENDGWVVIRVWESEIKKDITSIVDMVERVYRERKKILWQKKRVVVSLKKGNFDDEFSVLMRKVNDWLNTDATNRPDYYRKRDGNPLEEDVYDAIVQKAKRTVLKGR